MDHADPETTTEEGLYQRVITELGSKRTWTRVLFRWIAVGALPALVALQKGAILAGAVFCCALILVGPVTLIERAITSVSDRPPLLRVAHLMTLVSAALLWFACLQAFYSYLMLVAGASPNQALARVLDEATNFHPPDFLPRLVLAISFGAGFGQASAMASCTGRWGEERAQIGRFLVGVYLLVAVGFVVGSVVTNTDMRVLLPALVCWACNLLFITALSGLTFVAADGLEGRLFGPKQLDVFSERRQRSKRERWGRRARPPEREPPVSETDPPEGGGEPA